MSIFRYILIFLQGVLLGLVSIGIPGFSASTIAIIIGVYVLLVESIAGFFSNIKKVNELSKKDYKKRKKGLEDKLFKSKANKLYKYRNRYNIFDIIYMIANIGMLIFYILVVR